MDIASAMLHGRWHDVVNGLWNPGYPALLALGKLISHADRMHELQVFYWVNYCIFLASIACTAFFVRSLLHVRNLHTNETSTPIAWALPDPLLYIAAYSVVLFSWQQEFSFGKIRVDGLFAGLLLLAFAFLLRMTFTGSYASVVGMGLSLGLAYLVKSPGFVLAGMAFVVLAAFLFMQHSVHHPKRKILLAMVVFAIVVSPYITALSIQKGRFDFGDSGKLNYAWHVSGTQPMHLLNNQLWRFGGASVHLKHPDIELLSDPVVVYIPHFPHATYGSWFDPSYPNDGVHPSFHLKEQLRSSLRQSRHMFRFTIIHSILLAFPIVILIYGMRAVRVVPLRLILILFCTVFIVSFIMYVGVHFEDRYVSGPFWIAWIAMMGLLVAPSDNVRGRYQTEGATILLAITVLMLGVKAITKARENAVMAGTYSGWYNAEIYEAAGKLAQYDVPSGSEVACFEACKGDHYWARLASVHVTSEIYDTRYMPDEESPNEIWDNLPNKPAVYAALRGVGAKGIVGLFDDPPAPRANWAAAGRTLLLDAAGPSCFA
ncbi:MAG: hypothetical protein ACP5EP_12870, partial [Acidobacteriaceae bacterium]